MFAIVRRAPLVALLLTFVAGSIDAPRAAAALPAPPATPPDAAREAEAKKHFVAGVKLYAEKAYEAALLEFEHSYRLGGRASALKNVAQCYRDLKHFGEAYDAYA